MQKHEKRGFLGTMKHIFNVRLWLDTERITSHWQYILSSIKGMLIPQQKVVGETFEEAKRRMNLSNEDLDTRKRALLQLSILMVVICVFLCGYAFYHLFYGSIPGCLLTLSIMCVSAVMAFRYHFWYFQIKEKKLGCSIKEWFKFGLLGEKR